MEIKNYSDLAIAVSKLEGGKVNLPIAQIREVMTCLSDLTQQVGCSVCDILTKNGKKRAKKGVTKLL